MAVLESTKMTRNAGEDRQVVVVFASLELDESQPDMSRRENCCCYLYSPCSGQVRGTVAQSFGLSATTLFWHLSGRGTLKKRGGWPVLTEK